MPLFHVPVSLRIQKKKKKPSLGSHTSVAQHRFRTQQKKKNKKQQNVKIDLSLKVGEEK